MVKTIKRLNTFGPVGVITLSGLKSLTELSYRTASAQTSFMLYEPFGRNTAASIAWLCHEMKRAGKENEVVGIFPADQLVEDISTFHQAIRVAEVAAQKGRIVTLGIKPYYPATGFGYIELSENITTQEGGVKSYRALGFREKPTLQKATEFLESDRFVWNAGMFIFRVSEFIKHLERHLPDLWKMISSLEKDNSNIKEIYESVTPISIDYGVMEKISENVDCIPCDMGWSDIGSWNELSERLKSYPVYGEKNNFVHMAQQEKTVAILGIENLIVVDMPDALLVTTKEGSQRTGQLVNELEKDGQSSALEHSFDIRPWGDYQVLKDSDYYKSKIIRVNPSQQISYQSHAKRSEHWIIVKGSGIVVLNDKEIIVTAGQHILIPLGAKHRIKNTGQSVLEFIEVQTGTYFGEDDIVRYQDDYGRNPGK